MTDKVVQKPEVWLRFRRSGASVVHSLLLEPKRANRLLRTLNRKSRHGHCPLDYCEIQGTYEPTQSLEEAKGIVAYAVANNAVRRAKAQKIAEADRSSLAEARRSSIGRWRVSTTKMSFQLGNLSQAVIVACPITGIVGKLEMPFAPLVLEQEHPLSKASNVLKMLDWYFSPAQQKAEIEYLKQGHINFKLDRQVLAGCLLSLLRSKSLIDKEAKDTTALEQNMVLQNAGHSTLSELLKIMVSRWSNPDVWKRVPKLSVEWNTHSTNASTIGYTLNKWAEKIKEALEPVVLTSMERAKLFSATQNKPKVRVKVYTAAAAETRNIKENKTEAYKLLDFLKPHLSIAQRIAVQRTLQQLLLLSSEAKSKTVLLLKSLNLAPIQKDKALALAAIIERSSNESIFKEVGSVMQEVSPTKTRSIAEILARKKEVRENLEQIRMEQQTKTKSENNGN